MPSESLLLGNVLEFKNGKNHPGLDQYEQYDVYGANGPIGKTSDFNTEGDTIVIGRVGSYCGSLHFSTEKGWVTDNAIAAKALKPIETKFWFYALQSMGLERWRAGSGQPLITQSTLKSLLAPNVEPQDRLPIAGVLGALDDLIDTNEQLIRRLREIMRGAYLRAASSTDREVSFGDVATLVRDRAAGDGSTKYLGLEHLAEGGFGITSHGTLDDVGSSQMSFRAGDVLYGKLRPYFRKVDRPWFEGACSAEIWVLRPTSAIPASFLHAVVDSADFTEFAMTGSEGTRMPRAKWEHVKLYPVPSPTTEELIQFDSLCQPTWETMGQLKLEIDELRHTRDELLPLLMSGKIRVREAEEVVASVTKESA